MTKGEARSWWAVYLWRVTLTSLWQGCHHCTGKWCKLVLRFIKLDWQQANNYKHSALFGKMMPCRSQRNTIGTQSFEITDTNSPENRNEFRLSLSFNLHWQHQHRESQNQKKLFLQNKDDFQIQLIWMTDVGRSPWWRRAVNTDSEEQKMTRKIILTTGAASRLPSVTLLKFHFISPGPDSIL